MLFVEHCEGLYHTAKFIPHQTITNKTGYVSIYRFETDAAAKCSSAGSVSNLLINYPAFTDELVIDLDDGDYSKNILEKYLVDEHIGYRLYSSGGKGYHVYLSCQPMGCKDTPHSQKMFVDGLVKKLGIEADLSIYKHTGLIKLEGTPHPVTGKTKQLIRDVAGGVVNIPVIAKPKPLSVEIECGLSRPLNMILASLKEEPGPGNRHTRLWSIAKTLRGTGANRETIEWLIQSLNAEWENPKEAHLVSRVVDQVMGRY